MAKKASILMLVLNEPKKIIRRRRILTRIKTQKIQCVVLWPILFVFAFIKEKHLKKQEKHFFLCIKIPLIIQEESEH